MDTHARLAQELGPRRSRPLAGLARVPGGDGWRFEGRMARETCSRCSGVRGWGKALAALMSCWWPREGNLGISMRWRRAVGAISRRKISRRAKRLICKDNRLGAR